MKKTHFKEKQTLAQQKMTQYYQSYMNLYLRFTQVF